MRRRTLWNTLAVLAGTSSLLVVGCNSDRAWAQTTGNQADTTPAPADTTSAPADTTSAPADTAQSTNPTVPAPDEVSAPDIGGRPSVQQPDEARIPPRPSGFRTVPTTQDDRFDRDGDGRFRDEERPGNIDPGPGLIDDLPFVGGGYPVIVDREAQGSAGDTADRNRPENRQYFAPLDRGPRTSPLYQAAQQARRERASHNTVQGRLQLLQNRIDRLGSMIVVADEVEKPALRESLDRLRALYRAAEDGDAREHLRAADREWRQAMRVFRGA